MGQPEVGSLEEELRLLSSEMTRPRARECLVCYLYRMLEFGCRGHEFTVRYRDLRAPRATALLARLGRMGGLCCECEVFMNAYQPNPRYFAENDDGDYIVDPMPPCHGVRRGSTQPCCLWVRIRRW
ncbi:MAG: DUF2695 domain-containing protein [Arthrobacter sp.]|uniref:DUF2695 domain-containing protein n=1 Tax=Arthrobacter sp. TaxID=1667 RepID=UPI00348C036F